MIQRARARARARAARWALCASLIVAPLSLIACHSTPTARTPAKAAAKQSSGTANGTEAAGASAVRARYAIDAQRSEVLVLVYRDGPMGHLGHNHVIAVRSLSGSISIGSDPLQSSFTIDFPVDAMSVDEPQLRTREGPDFDTTLDEAAIAGTRDHMLGASLLNASSYPTIHLQSGGLRNATDGMHIMTDITVRTTTARVDVPVSGWHSDDREFTVSGEFDLTHSQLGLTPYSVALGALRVAERMHVRYQLLAIRER